MSVEQLSSIAAVVLSLFFSYVPGVKGWYEKLDGEWKRLIMAGLLLVVAGGAYGVSCLQWFSSSVACDAGGGLKLLQVFLAALIANQATFMISPKKAK
jgi:hypothetical protein